MDIIHHVFETTTPEHTSLEELEWEEGLEDAIEDPGYSGGVGDSPSGSNEPLGKEELDR